jgi:aspartate kinase
LLVVSGQNDECTRNCHKNYFDKSAELNSCSRSKKYHNQILMDLFEDDKNDVFVAVNTQFADLEYFWHTINRPITISYTTKL